MARMVAKEAPSLLINGRDLVARIVATFPEARRVVLFGMHPRDETHVKRELDLLVVTPTTLRPASRSALLRKWLQSFEVDFRLLVVTPEECEHLRTVPEGVVARALEEGTTLYERHQSEPTENAR